jgi:hypothetical protein
MSRLRAASRATPANGEFLRFIAKTANQPAPKVVVGRRGGIGVNFRRDATRSPVAVVWKKSPHDLVVVATA